MANLLVTGGAGFIGSNFVLNHLSQYHYDNIVVLDALTYAGKLENLTESLGDSVVVISRDDLVSSSNIDNNVIDLLSSFSKKQHHRDNHVYYDNDATQILPRRKQVTKTEVTNSNNHASNHVLDEVKDITRVVFIQADINDSQVVMTILKHCNIDFVVNFAAESHVDRSIEGPAIFMHSNVLGTYNLINTVHNYEVETGNKVKFHQISTDEVYGSLALYDKPFTEESPIRPNSPYSASKAAVDCLVRPFAMTYGMHVTISNCSNNFGPRQHNEKLIPKTIKYLLEGKSVPIYGSGKQVRDWISVLDHCQGIELCLKHGKSGHTYNIGASCEISNIEMVEMIGHCIHDLMAVDNKYAQMFPNCRLINEQMDLSDEFVEHVEDRLGHDFRYALNYKKAELFLGYRPSIHDRSGLYTVLRETVRWYMEHYQSQEN